MTQQATQETLDGTAAVLATAEVDRKALVAALQRLARAVPNKKSAAWIRRDAKAKGDVLLLEVASTLGGSQQFWVRCPLVAETTGMGQKPEPFAVHKLLKIAKASKRDRVTIQVNDGSLGIVTEKGRFTLTAPEYAEHWEAPDATKDGMKPLATLRFSQLHFLPVLQKLVKSASKQCLREYLRCVTLDMLDEGRVHAVATDGHRMGIQELTNLADTSGTVVYEPCQAMLAENCAKEIAAIKPADADINIEVVGEDIEDGDTHIVVNVKGDHGNVIYVAKAVNGQYPAWRKVRLAKDDCTHYAVLDAAEAAEAIEGLWLIHKSKAAEAFVEACVSGDAITLRTKDEAGGGIAERALEKGTEASKKPFADGYAVKFNMKFFTDMLTTLDGAIYMGAKANHPKAMNQNPGAHLFFSIGSDGYEHIIMPVRD